MGIARLRRFLPPALALIALLAGLVPGVLETGQVDPLDWLLPCGLALLILLLIAGRAGIATPSWRLAYDWLLVAAPALLLCATIGTRLPILGLVALGLALALVILVLIFAARRGALPFWAAAALLLLAIAVPTLAGRFQIVQTRPAGPAIGVLSALPLQGGLGHERGQAALRTVGLRSPLWQALEARFTLDPLDALDAARLGRFNALLLAQPRQLMPAELVALDAWVREGGHVVILADPLLRWPDPRPLAHPRRAPLTSLLDPLLRHWGLTLRPALEAARIGVERRVLADGSLLQLAGASTFEVATGSPCRLEEQGLVARCPIGKGQALLVADADWINDDLWTLAPETPLLQRRWTGDAIPILSQMLDSRAPASRQSWLVGEKALFAGIRWALALLLLVALLPMISRLLPGHSQVRPNKSRDQMENGERRDPNSG